MEIFYLGSGPCGYICADFKAHRCKPDYYDQNYNRSGP